MATEAGDTTEEPMQEDGATGLPTARDVAVALRDTLAAADREPTGLYAGAVVFLVTALLTIPLYDLLGWPAATLEGVISGFADPGCATSTTGLGLWFCGLYLSLVSVAGAVLVVVVLFLLRRRIAAILGRGLDATVPEARFLVAPVITAIVFTMGWAGVEFHFFRRDGGFILDGLVPLLVGLVTYGIVRYGPHLHARVPTFFERRDRIGMRPRLAATVAVPLALPFLLWFLHPAKVEQLVIVVSLLVGFLLLTPRSGDLGAAVEDLLGRRGGGARAAGATLLVLAALLLLAPNAVAFEHCTGDSWLAGNPQACDQAHHHQAFVAASAGIGVAAALAGTSVATLALEGTARPPAGTAPGSDGASADLGAGGGRAEAGSGPERSDLGDVDPGEGPPAPGAGPGPDVADAGHATDPGDADWASVDRAAELTAEGVDAMEELDETPGTTGAGAVTPPGACPACGHAMEEPADACPACGADLEGSPQA